MEIISHKVSVALCTYNGEKYIAEQLDSILCQTRKVNEIIICDDCSDDKTIDKIEKYQKQYPSVIKFNRNTNNIGAKNNFEKCLSLCSGDIIFLSDQDDVWLPDKVEKVLHFFKNNPLYQGVFTNGYLIDESNTVLNGTLLDSTFFKDEIRRSYTNVDLFYWSILLGNMITGATIAIKKSVLPEVIPLKFKNKLWHDGWIGLVLMAQQTIGYLDECLIKYRIHPKQQIGVNPQYDSFEKVLYNHENISSLNIKEFFPKYLNAWSFYCDLRKYIYLSESLEKRILKEYTDKKYLYFKSQPFFEKKLRLIKWYLKSYPGISLRDVFKL